MAARLSSFRCAPAGKSAYIDFYCGRRTRLAHGAQVRLDAAPESGLFVLRVGTAAGPDERALVAIDASGTIGARAGGRGGFMQGPALQPGRSYRIDLVYDVTDPDNHTLDWQIDGVPQPQATYEAGISTEIGTVGVGYEGTGSKGLCYFKPDAFPATALGPVQLGEHEIGLRPPLRQTARAIRRWPIRLAKNGLLLLHDLTRHPRKRGCTKRTRECHVFTEGPDVAMPACCVAHLTELAAFLSDLLTRNGIVHWLDYGTLLGAVRNGEFIPWDQDVDFSIHARDRFRLLDLGPEITAAGYRFDPNTLEVYYGRFNYNHADFWLWQDDGEQLTLGELESFPKHYVETLTEVTLCGKTFPSPTPVHRFLAEQRYGEDYMTPKPLILNYFLRPGGERSYLSSPTLDGDSDVVKVDEFASTGTSARLIRRIAEADWRFHERVTTRFFRRPIYGLIGTPAPLRFVQHLFVAGLPAEPDEGRVARLRAEIPEQAAGRETEQLIRRLALVEQAVDELEGSRGGFRRTRRRLAWAARAVAARLVRRDPPLRFPYWLG
jgi:hypothetical protein